MLRCVPYYGVLMVWMCMAIAAPAQQQYVIRTWNAEQGLPQDAVRAIAQTPDGYLWVATFGGLAQFDGSKFEIFSTGNTPALPDNLINALFCDRQGRLWIGHDTGHVTVMEGRQFRRVTMPTDWRSIPIRSFGENAGGEVWALNALWNLAVITPKGVQPPLAGLVVSDPPLHFEVSAPDGRLRIITQNGRCYVARTNGIMPDPDAPTLPSDGRRVIRSRMGGYWAVHENRLARWQGGKVVETMGQVDWGEAIFATTCEWHGVLAAGSFREGLTLTGGGEGHARLDTGNGLPSNWIAALFVDKDGLLWLGTGDAGLVAIWPKRVQIFRPPGEAASKHVQSVSAGVDGGIWVATEGAGLFRFDGNAWWQAPDIPGLRLHVYSCLCMAEDGRLCVNSSSGGLYYLQDEKWHRISGVSRLVGARGALLVQDNILWAAVSKNLLRFSGKDFAQVHQIPGGEGVCCLAGDGTGGIWFGAYGAGLGHWRNNQTTVLHTTNGLPSENVLSLYLTGDGSLWIGTDGAGLVRMKDGQFTVISKAQGLPSDTVCQIIGDDEGRLWLGTYGGICAVTVHDVNLFAEGQVDHVRCLVLDTADGMETQECSAGNQPSVCRTADRRLWFATCRGVAVVSPSSIEVNTNPPLVWIEQVWMDTRSVVVAQSAGSVTLPRGQRRLQLTFNAPCLRAAYRVRFKHRLDPVERDWIDSGNNREVTYAGIPPGHYTFRVIACNEDGVWNTNGASLAFSVPPFLWERVWFTPVICALALGMAAAIVIGFLRQRWKRRLDLLKQQRVVERERSRIAKDLHDDLGGSLTEIGMLAELADIPAPLDDKASDAVARIGRKSTQLVRALDEIVWAVNPTHDSILSLADYLSGYSQEFLRAAGIRLRLDIQRNLPAISLSPECRHEVFLAAKEALNNVVRHSKCSEVCIRLHVKSGKLNIVVEDNGCGFDVAALSGGGDGLVNMRERLAAMDGCCQISSQIRVGTTVHLELTLP